MTPPPACARFTGLGAWSKATYSVIRQSVPVDMTVILVPAERSLNYWLRFIALIYLGIGLYVLLRRWTAPSSTHFYIFCLVSFIFYAFKFSGKLNDFDWTIYWGNVVAWLLQPALFLHFVLTFPEKRNFVRKHRWIIPAIYVPGMLLLGIHIFTLRLLKASERVRWNLDRIQMGYLALFFVVAAGVFGSATGGPARRSCASSSSGLLAARSWPSRRSPCST